MMRKIWLLFFSVLFFSCDILRTLPFEVRSWTPGDGFHAEPGDLNVSILFSDTCDRTKTEQAFSFSEDTRPLKGEFKWDGNKLEFIPSSPLGKNHDYRISLGTGAQSAAGLSLDRKFEVSFTTRPPGGRPRVILTSPEYDGIILEERDSVMICFSEPVSLDSCVNHISFMPSVLGTWSLDDEGRLASFIPLAPWKTNIRYRVNVQSAFSDIHGRTIGDDYSFFFDTAINGDSEKPKLVSAWALNKDFGDAELFPDDVPAGLTEDFSGWESLTKLRLDFSEPVDAGSVRDRLNCEPYAALVMETPLGFASSIVFRFAQAPVWQSRFIFKLNSGVYDESGNETDSIHQFRIRADGAMSKPPSLIGMRLPLAPGNDLEKDQDIAIFVLDDPFPGLAITPGTGRFPYSVAKKFWIELYFDTAPETAIDLFSVMELFQIEVTGRAFTFSAKTVIDENFSWTEPAAGWESFRRVEIGGFLTNAVESGMATFRIKPGLRDVRGNRNSQVFEIKLVK